MTDFRAVKEEWFQHSATFVDRDHLIALLSYIANAVGTSTEQHEYGDVTSVTVLDGQAFLDFVADDSKFQPAAVSRSLNIDCSWTNLESLIQNMKALEPGWRKAIDRGNTLVFYVD